MYYDLLTLAVVGRATVWAGGETVPSWRCSPDGTGQQRAQPHSSFHSDRQGRYQCLLVTLLLLKYSLHDSALLHDSDVLW